MGTKLKLLNADGQVWETTIDPATSVQKLKEMTFEYFIGESSDCSVFEFRLINPADFRTLGEFHAIKDEHLKDQDTLLFVQHRVVISHEVVPEVELKAPTMAEIIEATKHLAAQSLNAPVPSSGSNAPAHPGQTDATKDLLMLLHNETTEPTVDFQVELRKIIISLITVMAAILHGNPDAEQICQEMQSKLKNRVNHLIAHQTSSTPPALSPADVISTPMGIVEAIIRIRKQEFHPDPKAVDALKEMGFTEAEIIDALRANKNKSDKAAEWLISKNHTNTDDIDTGLDKNSHLFNSLVTNPAIRLGLNNPKTLVAFLGILDAPNSSAIWMNDPDTANVITTIFKVYHAEKHAVVEETHQQASTSA